MSTASSRTNTVMPWRLEMSTLLLMMMKNKLLRWRLEMMRFDHKAFIALGFVALRADGERELLFFRHPSADMLLTEAELDKNLIQKVRFCISFDLHVQ